MIDIRKDDSGLWCDDITFCSEKCGWRECPRNKVNIHDRAVPHSFSVEIPSDCPKQLKEARKMQIELRKYPTQDDIMWMKECTVCTMGKEAKKPPTSDFVRRLLVARHSPIRELTFSYVIRDIPYWVTVHLVRHHVGFQPYVQSQRNDRQDNYDRTKAPQDTPVTMCVTLNAEALLNLANKRLCAKASPETREVVQRMCNLAEKVMPEFHGLLVPMCEYHGNVCYEINGCGKYNNPLMKEIKNESNG